MVSALYIIVAGLGGAFALGLFREARKAIWPISPRL